MSLIILLVVLLLLFGGYGSYWGHTRYGATNGYIGPGIGVGTVVVVLLVLLVFHVI